MRNLRAILMASKIALPVESKNSGTGNRAMPKAMSIKIVALLMLLSGLGIASSWADEKVSVALYLAENAPPPPDIPLAPERLHHRLHEVFGFKHYELLRMEDIDLGSHWQQWVLPRKDFFIRLEPLPRKADEPPVLDYELYKDGFIVVKGMYEPCEDTPLFINGPDFKRGRLIFVLEPR